MRKTVVAPLAVAMLALGLVMAIPSAALAGQWAAPGAMPTGASTAGVPAIDGSGTVTAIWAAGGNDACSPYDATPGCEIRVARRGASVWSDSVTLSTGDASTAGARVVADAAGTVTAMWVQTDGTSSGTSVYASRFSGGAWSRAVRLSAPGTGLRIYYTALVVAKDGSVIAVWDDDVSQRDQYARFVDGAWTAAAEIPSGGRPSTYIDALVASPDGSVTALMRQTSDRIGSARFVDGTWSDEGLISPPGRAAYGGAAAVDTSGNVTAVWHSFISGHYQIEAVRRVGGTWGSVEQLTSTAGHAQNAHVVIAGDGAPIAVWDVMDGSYSNPQISYSRFASGAWSASTAIGVLPDQSSVDALAVDAAGAPFLVAGVFDTGVSAWGDVSLSYTQAGWGSVEALVPGVTWRAGSAFAMNEHGSGVAIGERSDQSNALQVVRYGVAPAAPIGVRGTGEVASIDVRWDAARPSDALPVSAYVATADPGGRTCSTTGATRCTIDGLKVGTTYRITVAARNELGLGPASTPSDPIALPPIVISTAKIVTTSKGSTASVRVPITVPGPGDVTLTGTTPGAGSSTRRAGGAPVWRCTVAVTFTKAGTRVLNCRLRDRARQQLRRGALHFTFRTDYVPAAGAPVTAVAAVVIPRHR